MKLKLGVVTFIILLVGLGAYFILGNGALNQLGTNNANTSNTIKIAFSSPLGINSAVSSMNAIRLALEETNYKVGQYNIELLVLDDGNVAGAWDEKKEEQNAKQAANDPQVVAYIGALNSGASKISMPILNKAGIVQISQGNTWPGLTKTGFAPTEPEIFYPTGTRHYFRVVTTDDLQGPAGAVWADELGMSSVYILDDGEAYGKGIATLFAEKYRALGLEVKKRETIEKTATDFSEVVLRIKSANPDLVYYGGNVSNGITDIIPQLRKAGYKGSIMGPDALLDQTLIDRVGASYSEGVYVTTVGVPAANLDSAEAKTFLTAYEAKYKTEPEVFGGTAYVAAKIILQAIEKGGTDRKAVLKAVSETQNFDSMYGPITFDEQGDVNQKLLSASKVKNGKFEFVKQLSLP